MRKEVLIYILENVVTQCFSCVIFLDIAFMRLSKYYLLKNKVVLSNFFMRLF